jgi:hypothetical protein
MKELRCATRRSFRQLKRLRTHRGIERRNRERHPVLQEGSVRHGSAGALTATADRETCAAASAPDRACRVMILSAAVGGGHNAAAEGLREELPPSP